MDPVTAALNFATALVQIATKVWDATPKELQQAEAKNWAQFCINIGDFIIGLQPEIKKLK